MIVLELNNKVSDGTVSLGNDSIWWAKYTVFDIFCRESVTLSRRIEQAVESLVKQNEVIMSDNKNEMKELVFESRFEIVESADKQRDKDFYKDDDHIYSNRYFQTIVRAWSLALVIVSISIL